MLEHQFDFDQQRFQLRPIDNAAESEHNMLLEHVSATYQLDEDSLNIARARRTGVWRNDQRHRQAGSQAFDRPHSQSGLGECASTVERRDDLADCGVGFGGILGID